MEVIIDRFENDLAIVEIEVGKTVAIPKILVPNAKEGDIITITINHHKTEERKEYMNDLVNSVFED